MIIATAGHVDHGKTLLVKALTGIDADRLPEEKKRGMTIDLGFAYLPMEGAETVGFVDVPGHERFIHNMLAGVAGIDFVLFVLAADDGVMPQTLEHLAILDLLNVRRGAVALTKIDRVEPSRLAEIRGECAGLRANSSSVGGDWGRNCRAEGLPAARSTRLSAKARFRQLPLGDRPVLQFVGNGPDRDGYCVLRCGRSRRTDPCVATGTLCPNPIHSRAKLTCGARQSRPAVRAESVWGRLEAGGYLPRRLGRDRESSGAREEA